MIKRNYLIFNIEEIKNKERDKKMEQFIKVYIQSFNDRMTNDQLNLKPK